jgi:two-component system nitrate/nitrite sensor histidine kinase NarX
LIPVKSGWRGGATLQQVPAIRTCDSMPPQLRKLGAKLTMVAMAYLAIALAAIGVTLLAAWQLEGGAAAINQLGSERMRSWQLASLLAMQAVQPQDQARLSQQAAETMTAFQRTLDELRSGDPARPMFLPHDSRLQTEFEALAAAWRTQMEPAARALLRQSDAAALSRYQSLTAQFVQRIDQLVLAVEHDLSDNTALLRSLQLGLISLSVIGSVGLIGLMFLLVMRPVMRLQEGIQAMQRGDFDVRLPVETRDEFGELATGFNEMAGNLSDLYRNLEARVAQKTRTLAEQNSELGLLYEITSLLSQPMGTEALCRAFLDRVSASVGAQAASVRLLESEGQHLHLVTGRDLAPALAQSERCRQPQGCACGDVAQTQLAGVFPLKRSDYPCAQAGYDTIAVFPIRAGSRTLGLYNLMFCASRTLDERERNLLETLGRHLGVAIENQRLAARERQAAVYEERNLLAQELHDSIAQSLAFLNLEAQMLQRSLDHGEPAQAAQELSCIREGIQQSCDDVRELLVHFRARPGQAEVADALAISLERFQQHTGIATSFDDDGVGMPLDPEIQVHVLHILQEALSNVRKHAHASHVRASIERGAQWRFVVEDDGCGFDPAVAPSEQHVGLNIMRERAQRIGARLDLVSAPGRGTRITLSVPVAHKAAA